MPSDWLPFAQRTQEVSGLVIPLSVDAVLENSGVGVFIRKHLITSGLGFRAFMPVLPYAEGCVFIGGAFRVENRDTPTYPRNP